MTEIGVALLGAGRVGRLHAANVDLTPGLRLAAVVDPVADLDPWRRAGVRVARDAGEVLDDPAVEAVLVCTPTTGHLAAIEAAAAAGRHVFCEKPVDLDPQRVVRAIDAVDRAGVKLQVGFNRRFDPSFRRLRETLRDGGLGDLYMVRIVSRDPAPPSLDYLASSGGIFLDMMIHDFDMVRFLSGDEITEVHSFGAVRVDPAIADVDDVDTAVVSLRLASGALAVIENCRRATYGYDQRIELTGSEGGLEACNETPTRTRRRTERGVRTDGPLHFFVERYERAFRAELAAFAAAIRDDTPTPVDGRDGLAAVVVGHAARRSLATGRSVLVGDPVPIADAGSVPRGEQAP